jgi:hypothetical protein
MCRRYIEGGGGGIEWEWSGVDGGNEFVVKEREIGCNKVIFHLPFMSITMHYIISV